MNTYRWNAQDYAQNSQAQQQWAKELIAQLQLSGRENVLDLGCGDGKVTAEIAEIVDHGTVVGIDNSAAMIALAQGRYPDQQHPNLSFRVMDAGSLNFTESPLKKPKFFRSDAPQANDKNGSDENAPQSRDSDCQT